MFIKLKTKITTHRHKVQKIKLVKKIQVRKGNKNLLQNASTLLQIAAAFFLQQLTKRDSTHATRIDLYHNYLLNALLLLLL